MRCPYCRTPLTESSAECPACRLTLNRAATLLGPIPRLSSGIADLANVLTPSQKKKIRRAITAIEWRFPQLRVHVLCHYFQPEQRFELQVFWLFNLSGLSGEHEKLGRNHHLLLALDPASGLSAIMPGYGLEPFLPEEALDHLLELAGPNWSSRRWSHGILEVLHGLEQLLEASARDAEAAFCLPAPRESDPSEF